MEYNGNIDQDIVHDYSHRNFKIEKRTFTEQQAIFGISSRGATSSIEFNAAYCGCDQLSLENVHEITVCSDRAGRKGEKLSITRNM
ncbi:MAG: hypothetical protein LBG52_05175 [Candidatus Peribacteria bacterium]|nr:hypothetical protein [Candidatus Peribacteria bacterium]